MQQYNNTAEYRVNLSYKWIIRTEVYSECGKYYWKIKEINHQDCSNYWLAFHSSITYKETFEKAEEEMFNYILNTFKIPKSESDEIKKYLKKKWLQVYKVISFKS